jgi:hypothetical protein
MFFITDNVFFDNGGNMSEIGFVSIIQIPNKQLRGGCAFLYKHISHGPKS